MGVAKRKQWDRRQRERNRLKAAHPQEIWNVRGWDQHGEYLSFDEPVCSRAHEHADRLNSLGGSVQVVRMVWNSAAAGYREPRGDE